MGRWMFTFRPACFDTDAQFADWCASARESHHPIDDYCSDCTPEHKRRMLAQQRCGRPERPVFVASGDGCRRGRVALDLSGVLR